MFVFVVWLALITAVLCAICPAGSPRSRSIGPSFSPSTPDFAIRGREKLFPAAPERIARGGDTGPSADLTPPNHQPVVLPSAALSLLVPFPGGELLVPSLFAAPPARARIQLPLPRGPPLA